MRDELQFHLEAYAGDLMAKRGLSREEALRKARVDFGSVDKCTEAAREARGLRFPDEIRRNALLALRQFRHNSGFAIVSILTLGLGIGVNTAIFSLFYQFLLCPLPAPNPKQLVNLTSPGPKTGDVIINGTGGLDLALLIVAWYVAKNLFFLNRIDLGLKADNLIVSRLSPSLNGYDSKRSAQLYERLKDELSALPGVISVANSESPILGGALGTEVSVQGYSMDRDADAGTLCDRIGPGYFRTLGIPLLSGREFTRADADGAAKAVAIVNEAFADKFKLGRNVLGKRMGYRFEHGRLNTEIIGLVKNSMRLNLLQPPSPLFYFSYRQNSPSGSLSFYVRTSIKPDLLMPAIKKVAARLDPNLPVDGLRTMRQLVRESMYDDRMFSVLMTAFACLAILLTAVGLHGVLAYSIAQRRPEIGLRIAMGATRARVRANVFRQAGVMTLVGCAAGMALAVGLIRSMQSLDFFYQRDGLDPVVFMGSAAFIAFVTAAAVSIPAYRASKIDPMSALRYE